MFCRGFDESVGALGVAEIAAGGFGMERFAVPLDGRERTAAERAQLRRAAQGVARPREHLFLRHAHRKEVVGGSSYKRARSREVSSLDFSRDADIVDKPSCTRQIGSPGVTNTDLMPRSAVDRDRCRRTTARRSSLLLITRLIAVQTPSNLSMRIGSSRMRMPAAL